MRAVLLALAVLAASAEPASAAAAAATAAAATAAVWTVYAAGDIADCRSKRPEVTPAAATAELVARELAANPRASVLLLGDNVYQRGSAAAYRDCYDPTWGRFKERTHPAPGNHEYATPGASGYFDYFGAAAGPGYFALKLGAWRVISLDSNLDGEAMQTQLAWLTRELAGHRSHCTLAYWHHPLYSSGGHPPNGHMRAAWQLLQRAGAELVLSGHDHDYERFAPQDADGEADRARGMRQFVVGTGGAYATPFLWPRANSEVRDANRSGVLKLVLGERGYTWEFLEATYDGFPNGQPPDRGSGTCHK